MRSEMSSMFTVGILVLYGVAFGHAYDPPEMRKEAEGEGAPYPDCTLEESLTGTCENYRWFNLCSGYIWVYSGWEAGEAVGVQFGGRDEQYCIWAMSCEGPYRIRRVITYYRDVVPGYGNLVDVLIQGDYDGDGVGEGVVDSYLGLDPSERWNCTEPFERCDYLNYAIVTQVHRGGPAPAFATDGPFAEQCGAPSAARSFYYGVNISTANAWTGPTGRADNFLVWLVVDDLSATGVAQPAQEVTSWGRIKGLYR